MSTATTTSTKVEVKAEATLVASIATLVVIEGKADAAWVGVAETGLRLAKKLNLTDRADVSSLFRLSYYQQAEVLDLPDTDPKKVEIADRIKTNVSLWTTFVLPTGTKQIPSADAAKGRDAALDYNAKLPKGRVNERIGQKWMLQICRGQVSAEDVIALKEGRPTSRPLTASPAKGNTAQPTTPTTPATNDPASPEAQQASIPTPANGVETLLDNRPVIGSPTDMLKSNMTTMMSAFETNFNIPRPRFVALVAEWLTETGIQPNLDATSK